ncbi:16184_t:CDS:2, partial [Gigaspora margarita]
MSQKYEAKARQPKIPEAPIFEPGNGDRIYEALVSESDNENI